MKHYLILLLVLCLWGCYNPPAIEPETVYGETQFTDSFEIKGMEARVEVQSLWWLNDTSLLSYNSEGSSVHYYTRKENERVYRPWKKINLKPRIFLPGFFRDDKGSFRAMDDKHSILHYDADFNVTDSLVFDYTSPYYKKRFQTSHTGMLPAISLGDTLICFIGNADAADYIPYSFKERPVIESIWKEGKLIQTDRIFEKPANLTNYMSYFGPFYAFNKNRNTLALAYPCYDTLYVYKRSTKQYEKVLIGNKDFSPLEVYDQARGFDFAYLTKYCLANFSYHSMYFNTLTNHYILFYYAPNRLEGKNKPQTPKDLQLKAVILDEDFKIIRYLNFNYKYGDIQNLFFYPGKGFVLPLEKSAEDYADKKCFILNF